MSETNKPVVTRFAPSPTGYLHIGGARTALFAWAYARQQGGRFILRLEDTDQARSTAESTRRIIADMAWLGLDWDEGPSADPADNPYEAQSGDHGPYFQSQRLPIYQQYVRQLVDAGKAYEDGGAIRLRSQYDAAFTDEVYGRIEVKQADIEDFVIQKSDGFPTYHFAVVVDDHRMGVTHVIRGQEHLSNTPKHVAIAQALGFDLPVYVHLPSIMNPSGSKMSKRDKAKVAREAATKYLQANAGQRDALLDALVAARPDIPRDAFAGFLDKAHDEPEVAQAVGDHFALILPEIMVHDFDRNGYLPEVILNYIALLGWNPGGDVERFDLDFLVKHFSFARIGKANSRFDRDKLFRFNADTIAAMAPEVFRAKLKDHLLAYHADRFAALVGDEEKFALFAEAYRARARTLDEPAAAGRFFVDPAESITYDTKAVRKNLQNSDGEGLRMLAAFRDRIPAINPWTPDAIHQAIEAFVAEQGLANMGKIAQPLRVALTGTAVSPPIDQTLYILGPVEIATRIGRCLAEVSPTAD